MTAEELWHLQLFCWSYMLLFKAHHIRPPAFRSKSISMRACVLTLKTFIVTACCAFAALTIPTLGFSEPSLDSLSSDSLLSSQANRLFEEQPEFLPVDEAFTWEVEQQQEQVVVRWFAQEGYYLYRDRFNFSLPENPGNLTLGTPIFSKQGQIKDDPAFGMVEVFYDAITVSIPLISSGVWLKPITLEIGYQGCADAGLCYQPQSRTITLQPPGISNLSNSASTVASKQQGQTDSLADFIAQASIWLSLGTLFLLGIGLAFTPCVLPMVPILSSIIVGQDNLSTRKAFLLSLTYVLGMAIAYSAVGVLVGYFGAKANLQIYLQEPVVLISFALIFILLSLSMFGFYELQLPAFLRDRLDRLNQQQQGGHYLGVALMGILSALVVSPCVSAPLIGVLTYISTTGDALLGGLSLLALSLGMGFPLLLIGTGGGKFLPAAGEWMNIVKAVFGVLLLAVAVWLLERILPGPLTLVLWAGLLISSGIFMGALDKTGKGWPRLWKSIGLMFVIYGIILIIAAANGQSDPLRPLQLLPSINTPARDTNSIQDSGLKHTSHLPFASVNSLSELDQALATAKQENKITMLDFYADWCISCKIFERQTFSNPAVQAALSNALLLQADLSNLNKEHQAMLDRFGLFGLPSILFFNPTGEEIRSARIQGEMNAQQFLAHWQEKVHGQQ